MKHPNLTFIKSPYSDLKYKIFRFKNSNEDISLDYYVSNEADLIIDENIDKDMDLHFDDYPLFVEDSIDDFTSFYSVSAPFEIVKNFTKITINLKNSISPKNISKVSIYFAKNIISKVEYIVGDLINKTITDPNEIDKVVKIKSEYTILLNKEEIFSDNCSISIDLKVIRVIDEVANGLYEPTVNYIDTEKYYLLYQDRNKLKNIYYYKSIAYKDDTISRISDTKIIEISEDISNIKTIIEYSENYTHASETIWYELKGKFNPYSEIKISKDKKDIASNIVTNIYEHEIQADDRLVSTDGIRVIKLPNIWHKDKRYIMNRPKKAFRMKNILIGENIESNYTYPIEFTDDVEVLIDKMVILKKNVTGLQDDVASLPISFNDVDSTSIRTYIRQGGIYYGEYLSSNNDINNHVATNNSISIVTLDSRFPILSIKDNCIYSNKYNYTVYLFDEIGNISEPISVVM